MKVALFFCLSFFLLIACNPSNPNYDSNKEDVKANASSNLPVGIVMDTNIVGVDLSDSMDISDHFFGSFYQDQLEFYVVENPDIFFGDVLVNQMELGYLEGELMTKKYLLQADISQHLIQTYGNFTFRPLRRSVKEYVKGGGSVLNSDRTISDSVTHYQLKWTLGDQSLIYRVDPSADAVYTLTRQSKYYKETLASVR